MRVKTESEQFVFPDKDSPKSTVVTDESMEMDSNNVVNKIKGMDTEHIIWSLVWLTTNNVTQSVITTYTSLLHLLNYCVTCTIVHV